MAAAAAVALPVVAAEAPAGDTEQRLDCLDTSPARNPSPSISTCGVSDPVGYLRHVLAQLKQHPAKMIVRTPYIKQCPGVRVAERAHQYSRIVIPDTMAGLDKAKDLFGLYEDNRASAAGRA